MPIAKTNTAGNATNGGTNGAGTIHSHRVSGAAQIRNNELPVFTRALAAMLSSGLPLMEALQALEAQTGTRRFAAVIRRIRYTIETGHRLAFAMAQFPGIFNTMYVSMLRTGELSGRLAETLERIADYLESSAELRHRVRSAMTYPIVVACIAGMVAGVIMIWIVPAFEKIYADLGGTLPAATRALIFISQTLRRQGLLVFCGLVLAWIGFRLFKRTDTGAVAVDAMILKMPVFGPLAEKVALCRFAETLAQMLESGVSIIQALELSALATGNRVLTRSILAARTAVEGGETICEALRRQRRFPPLLIQMLTAGERAGRMDDMLQRTAGFYRNEVMITLKGLTAAIEPMMITILGLLVGGMGVCLFIPIFKLHEVVAF